MRELEQKGDERPEGLLRDGSETEEVRDGEPALGRQVAYAGTDGPDEAPGLPQQGERKRARRGGLFTAAVIVSLIIAAMLLAAGYIYMVLPARLPFGEDGIFTLMIVGTDVDYVAPNTRAEVSIGRADVVMLLLMPRKGQIAAVVSIPRDTLVPNGNGWDVRFNTLYKGLPPDSLMEGARKLTGLAVDRWIKVDFDAFVGFVDALGGIEVDVDKRMYYVDDAADYTINLQPGRQVLNGHQALGFVRYRQDALGDIARVSRQQKLVMALAKAAISLDSVLKIGELKDIVDKYVMNDMNLYEYAAIGVRALKVGPSNFETMTLPGHFSGPYWASDKAEIARLVERLKGGGER